MAPAAGVSSNSVTQIVIRASDQASGILTRAATALNSVGTSASIAQASVAALGLGLTSLGTTAVGRLNNLLQLFEQLQRLAQSAPAQTLFTKVAEEANDAVTAVGRISIAVKESAAIIGPTLSSTVSSLSLAGAGSRIGTTFATGFKAAAESGVVGLIDRLDEKLVTSIQKGRRAVTNYAPILDIAAAGAREFSGLNELTEVTGGLRAGIAGVASGVGNISEQIFFVTAAFQSFNQLVVNGPFQLLIGQNIELREQLLATQASLAATSKVFNFGEVVSDPGTAIESLTGPIDQAIKKLRQGSLELVGVTSDELVPLFQQVVQQSSAIGASIDQSVELALKFGAALGTLGVPLYQSRQEIGSILTATIDQNSVLAKTLNLTNEQMRTYINQGRAVEQLNKRLEAFRAGNALASKTIGGFASNIKEIFQEIGRQAGENFLDPLVDRLGGFYEYLKANTAPLAASVAAIAQEVFNMATEIADSVALLFSALGEGASRIPTYIFESLGNIVGFIGSSIQNTLVILKPFLTVLGRVIDIIPALQGPILQLFIAFKILNSGIRLTATAFTLVGNMVSPLGELLFLLNVRMGGAADVFANLSNQIGRGGAGFLLLGKNLNSIPGAAVQVSRALGAIGPYLTPLIPRLAQFGILLTGLSIRFPVVGQVIQTTLTRVVPRLLTALSEIVQQTRFLGGAFAELAPIIDRANAAVSRYTSGLGLAANVTTKFTEISRLAGAGIARGLVNFAKFTAGFYLLFIAIDEFILKNKGIQAALDGVRQAVVIVGKAVGETLKNPIVQATIALVAFVGIVRSGLIPSLIDATKEFLAMAAAGSTNFLANFARGVETVQAALSGDLGDLQQNRRGREKRQETQSALDRQKEEFQRQRDAIPEDIDLDAARERNQRNRERRAELRRRRRTREISPEVFAQELGNIPADIDRAEARRQNRENQRRRQELRDRFVRERAELRRQIVDIPDEIDLGKKRSERLGDRPLATRAKNVAQATRGTVTQLAGAAQELAGAALSRGGEFLGGGKFDKAGQGAKRLGEQLSQLSKKTLASEAAANGLFKSLRSGGATLGVLSNAAAGATAGFNSLKVAITEAWAAAGPLILIVAALTVAFEAIGSYSRIMESSTRYTKEFAAGVKEADDKLRLLAKAPPPPVDGLTLMQQRLKEIRSEQGLVTKFFELIRDRINNLIPGIGTLRSLAEIGAQLKIPGAQKLKDDLSPVKTEAETQINVENKDFDRLLQEGDRYLNKYSEETIPKVTQQEEALIKLQKEKAEASANGNSALADSKDKEIEKAQKLIDAERETVQARLDQLKAQKPNDEELLERQKDQIAHYEQMLDVLNNIRQVKLGQLDLPILGSALEQLQSEAADAEAALSKTTGNPEQVKAKADVLLNTTNELLKAGAISEEEARRRLGVIVNNVTLSTEQQIKAQQAITEAYKQEAQKQVEAIEARTTKIAAQAKLGRITEEEEIKQTTAAKREQLEIQIANANRAANEEIRLRQEALERDIADAQKERELAAQKNDQQGVDTADAKIATLRGNTAGAIAEVNRKTTNEVNKLQGESLQNDADERIRNIELAEKKVLAAVKQSQTRRQQQNQILFNEGRINEEERRERDVDANRRGTQDELKVELIKLEKLKALGKEETAEKRETRARINALVLESLKGEQEAMEAHIAFIQGEIGKELQVVENAETERAIAIQRLRNAGSLTKTEADAESTESNQQKIQAEIEVERDRLARLQANSTQETAAIRETKAKILQLTLQSEKSVEEVYDRNLAVRKEQIDEEVRAVENGIQRQNRAIEAQLKLYELQEKALDSRNRLLSSSKSLLTAGSGFLSAQAKALSQMERSEYRRQELAQTAAAIRVQALEQEQAIDVEILKIEQEKNRLALEREIIQNRISQSQLEVDIAKGEGDLAAARADRNTLPEQLAQLEIAQAKRFDALQATQDLGGVLQQQQQQLDRSQELDRFAQAIQQGTQQIEAVSELFGTLRSGQQAEARPYMESFILERQPAQIAERLRTNQQLIPSLSGPSNPQVPPTPAMQLRPAQVEVPEPQVILPQMQPARVEIPAPTIELPPPSEVEIPAPEVKLPTLEPAQINVPEPQVKTPDLQPIEVKVPSPEVKVAPPRVDAPEVEPVQIQIPVPDVRIPNIGAQEIHLPPPEVVVPEVVVPEMEPAQIDIPAPDIHAPKLEPTQINVPEPRVNVPDIETTQIDIPEPEVNLPDLEPVQVDVPKPQVNVPELEPTQIDVPEPQVNLPHLEPTQVNIPEPQVHAPDLTPVQIDVPKPQVNIPDLEPARVDVPTPEVNVPNLEPVQVDIPEPQVRAPDLEPAQVDVPEPQINLPDLNPVQVDVPKPEINVPELEPTQVDIPEPQINIPSMESARVDVPKPEVVTPELRPVQIKVPEPEVMAPEQKSTKVVVPAPQVKVLEPKVEVVQPKPVKINVPAPQVKVAKPKVLVPEIDLRLPGLQQFRSAKQFIEAGTGLVQSVLQKISGGTRRATRSNVLDRFDPGLEQLRRVLPSGEYRRAEAETARQFRIKYGDRPFGPTPVTRPNTAAPLRLPVEVLKQLQPQLRSAAPAEKTKPAMQLNLQAGAIQIKAERPTAQEIQKGVVAGLERVLNQANTMAST